MTHQPSPSPAPTQPVKSLIDAEASAYNEWFNAEQGTAYDGMWAFGRAAWMARASNAPAQPGRYYGQLRDADTEYGKKLSVYSDTAPAQPVQDLHSVNDAVTIDLLNERVVYLEAQLAKVSAPAQPGQEGEREVEDDQCRCEPCDYVRPADYDGDGSVSAMVRRATRAAPQPATADAKRLDWLDRNIYHREMGEWDAKFGGLANYNMWVMFAPKGHAGTARNIIDAALAAQRGVKP